MPLLKISSAILLLTAAAAAELPSPKIVERYKQMLEKSPVEGTALDRLWQMHVEAGLTAELLEEYRAGKSFAAQLVSGHFLRKAAQFEEAAAAYRRAAELDSASVLPHLALARLRAAEGATAEAAKAFEKAAELLPENDPKRAEVLLQLGEAWLAAGDAEKAADAWERTAALAPDNLDLRRRLADSYFEHRLPARALPHLQHLEKLAPVAERAQALQQIARVHQSAGDQDAAITALERALRFTAPGNWLRGQLQSQLIRLHQRYHRTPELETRWKNYAAENPRDLTAYLQLIDYYDHLGEFEPQRAWLEKLIALAPKTAEYRLRLARLLVQMDKLDGAATAYDQLLAQQPANADLVFERARLDVQRDNAPAASRRIKALLALRKEDDSIRARAVEFYQAQRLPALAEEHLIADAAGGGEEAIVALANFHFIQGRADDALKTLRRLVRPDETPQKRAAAHLRIAQLLKSQNLLDPAAAELDAAILIEPKSRDLHMLLGEVEMMRERRTQAQAAFERAFAASATPGEAAEADQKLFDSLQPPPQTPSATVAARRFMPGIEKAPAAPAVEDYLLTLTRIAAGHPTVETWLRVARWQLWNRSPRMAQEYAQKALAIAPASVEVHEFLIKLTEGNSQTAMAISHLQRLIEINPAQRLDYQRRIAQLQLQNGNIEEAMRLFTALAEAQPGHAEALTDLALAQQRAEAWNDALETWQQVHALLPPARRHEAVAALLRVHERLGMPQPAAELLLAQLLARSDEKERFQIFNELLTHCTKHQLLDWLKDRFEQQRKGRAEDYFTEMGLGRILKAMGEKAAAFEVLADASFSASNQAEALPELIREAEELRKLDAAVRLQEQLVRILPQPLPEHWEKLAQLQEKAFDADAAAATWERIAMKFPRDPGVLQRAVEFHLKWGDSPRAVQLLRRLQALDPSGFRSLMQLAELESEAGRMAEARAALEQILARSTPEAADAPLRFPGVRSEDDGRLQNTYINTARQRRGRVSAETMRALRSFWGEEERDGGKDRSVRLSAIRQLARLIQESGDAAALDRWIARWKAQAENAPSEALWAFFYSGANAAALDHIETRMQLEPDDTQLKQAFIWLTLQTGETARLSVWLQDKNRTAVERDFLLIALAQHIHASGGQARTGLIEELFPPGVRLRLWQVAAMFGNRGQFREAAQLGQRVFENLSSQRAAYGVELAHWRLYLGDVAGARKVLRECIGTSGDTFTAPVFTALREYYLLLPEAERAAFVEDYDRSLEKRRHPLHALLARTLLYGLSGREEEAQAQLLELADLGAMAHLGNDDSGNSASRRWDFLLTTGAQLVSWRLDSLAAALWEHALADEALIRLQSRARGDQVQARVFDIRTRLAAVKIARAPAWEAEVLMDEYARFPSPDGLLPLAEALEAVGATHYSLALYRQLWEREPGNPHALRNLISACRTSGDLDTLTAVLSRCVREGFFRGNEAAHRDLTMQYLDELERRGELPKAQQLLDQMMKTAPGDSRLLQRVGQLQERLGRPELAEAAYQRVLSIEPANASIRVALATLIEARGDLPAALDVLERATGVEVMAKLAALHLKMDQVEEAVAALELLPATGRTAATLLFVDALAEKGRRKEAVAIVRNALSRGVDARGNLPLQSKLIELLDPAAGKALIGRELRRLRTLTGDAAELLGGYYELALKEAPRLGWEAEFAKELDDDWKNGEGSLAAGLALLERQLAAGDDAAEATFERLLARRDAGEAAAQKMLSLLDAAARPDLAVRAQERLARANAMNPQPMLDWATRLHQLGREADSFAVLDELSARAVLNEDLPGRVAETLIELGAKERARPFFREAVTIDRPARNYQVHLAYARLLGEQREFSAARRVLRSAFRNPANREFGELAAYLRASGRLDRVDAELDWFDLAPEKLASARRAVFDELLKSDQAAAFLSFAAEHPHLAQPADFPQLRELVRKGAAFSAATQLLERWLAQSTHESGHVTLALAGIYTDWAAAELDSLQIDPALAHLRRAQELLPAFFPAASLLSRLHAERGDRKAAAATLEAFLAASKDADEREKARQLLLRLRP